MKATVRPKYFSNFLEYSRSSSTTLQLFDQSINTSLLIKTEPLKLSDDVASHSINAATS